MRQPAKSWTNDVTELERRVITIGDAVVKLVGDTTTAFLRQEGANADLVAETRDRIHALERDCADFALRQIGEHQPLPDDARAVIGVLVIADSFNRIASLCTEIAQRTQLAKLLPELPPLYRSYLVLQMATIDQLERLCVSLRSRDLADCLAEQKQRGLLREAQNQVLQSAVHMFCLTPRTLLTVADALMCANFLERIADHIATIADMMAFVKTGQRPASSRHYGLIEKLPVRAA
jgi:phosphate uptake regulator